jgi:phenylalanyl-tRNA synthetase beta chain
MGLTDNGRGGWDVVPPAFRFDIKIEEDLIEEVARLVGYSEIPRTPELSARVLADSSELTVPEDELVDILVARGYQEVITYSFIDQTLQSAMFPDIEPVALANPISQEMGVMRYSLWPGLLGTARANVHRQQPRQRLFEVGNQFEHAVDGVTETTVLAGLVSGARFPERWDNVDTAADFFDVKGDLEALIARTGRLGMTRWISETHPALHPGKTAQLLVDDQPAGWLGSLHPQLAGKFELDHPPVLFSLSLQHLRRARLTRYAMPSRFPALRRDLSVVVNEDVAAETIIREVKAAAGPVLREVLIFDVYRGEGIDSSRKSIALGLILQETSRTLTDDDAEGTVGSVVMSLVEKLGATIRK